MAKRQSSSQRDLEIPRRYDGSRRHDDKVYILSSQCLTLGSRNFIKLVSIKIAVLR
ncbi:hypothetical protein [Wolbachia endosymbiont of Zaprionus taronus]|uniref:hypothetical protein n=1 Tax=Wolbachia endosymbiont of Zaprionus taronus TaxID=2603208 RepID=UPI002949BAE8|nr:hypothetical protein [Wolbachia endosymbiont of Zaprionus taronus]MDV6249493.1 hypothetical protein [Wolbachia endosymbiont of Zaprionus taronus]